MEKQVRRLGVYGGTFSPPHLGHMHAAEVFLSEGGIDALFVIPTFTTPLKERDEATSPEDRLAMCRLAFSFSSRIFVSDIEIQRAGKSYTAQTLTALSAPDTVLSFLCGTDMFLSMDSWYHPETIFQLAEIVCMRREDEREKEAMLLAKAEEYQSLYGARIRFLTAPPMAMSSSKIRARIRSNEPLSAYLIPSVEAYICEKGLYR